MAGLTPQADRAAVTLDRLPLHQAARVVSVGVDGQTRRRLFDLGLTPGARVEPVLVGPFGDPRAYRVRGAVIAIREADARRIGVTPDGHGRG